METIEFSELKDKKTLEYIAGILRKNFLIIYPTDTIYGIGGDFMNKDVHNKVDRIKKRSDQPYSAAVSDMNMAEHLTKNIPDIFHKKYSHLLPGKFTFLFKAAAHIDREILRGSEKIGIRIPEKQSLLSLIKEFKRPLITSSVNRSKSEPLNSYEEIIDFLRNECDSKDIALIIKDNSEKNSKGSTIVDFTMSPPMILRRGEDIHKLSDIKF